MAWDEVPDDEEEVVVLVVLAMDNNGSKSLICMGALPNFTLACLAKAA